MIDMEIACEISSMCVFKINKDNVFKRSPAI
jgi:hypothetical protein